MLTNIAGVQFERTEKIYDFFYKNMPLNVGDQVWVDDDQGGVIGRVAVLKYEPISSPPALKSVIRLVDETALKSPQHYPGDGETRIRVQRVVEDLKLKMKILQCQFQSGSSKVLIYFSATKRVDFRELVKKLAHEFRCRIELRQIGPRDETKKVGGVGICGRAYCCSTFLREFVPVSIKMAKNQNLALNPNQIMGGCGKLLCCLTYEDDLYTHLRRSLPPAGSRIKISSTEEEGMVVSLDLLGQGVWWKSAVDRKKRQYCALADLEVLQRAAPRRGKKPRGSKKKKKHSAVPPKQGDAEETLKESWGDDMDMEALMKLSEETSSSSS